MLVRIGRLTVRKLLEVQPELDWIFRRLIDGLGPSALVALLTPDGVVAQLNQAALDTLGSTNDQAAYRTLDQLGWWADSPDAREKLPSVIRHAAAGKHVRYDTQIRTQTGHSAWIDFSLNPLRDEFGNVDYLVLSAIIISDRKQTEDALYKSRQRFIDLVNSTDGIVWEADAITFNFTFVSHKAERLLGFPVSDWLVPGFWASHVHPDDRERAVQYCMDRTTAGESHEFDYRFLAQDGRVVWLRDLVSVCKTEGQPTVLRGLMVDVTRRKEAEEQLRLSLKLQGLKQIARGISLEVNSHLAGIQNQIETLNQSALSQTGVESVRQIACATASARRLADNLLAFGSHKTAQPQRIDLAELVAGLVPRMNVVLGEGIHLETRLAPRLPEVFADPIQIEQAISSIAIHARNSMRHGGRLQIHLDTVDSNLPSGRGSHAHAAGTFVRIMMGCSGRGIPAANIETIFEPFPGSGLSGDGGGLGLSIVHSIIEQHQGWIDVRGTEGEGIQFHLHLPAAHANPPAPAPNLNATAQSGGNETILLTDDEPSVRAIAARILEKYGYSVIEAENGQAAIDAWTAHRGRIDLLLTDVLMPGGINGTDLARELLNRDPSLRVILSSGYGDTEIRTRFDFDHGQVFLQKPYRLQDLISTVRRCLDATPRPRDNASRLASGERAL